MKLTSKIKTKISQDCIRDIAAVCDTMRINSSQHKMLIIQQLLMKDNVKFSVLGGATNRLTLLIDGYTFKFAVDHQGYEDNFVEYSICRELQPYVTKTYETNGYILVAECVRTMSLTDFKLRKSDIERILSTLSQDYLLGDVGYIKKNYTNWGIRDDGSVVILDYAYIHRGTEALFLCEVCGNGILRYDSTFTTLKCSNVSSCNATFTYVDRKRVQGDQVDFDMIEEMKAQSVKLTKDVTEKEVTISETDGVLVSGNKKIIYSADEYVKYMEDKNKMNLTDYEETTLQDLLVAKVKLQNQIDDGTADKSVYDRLNKINAKYDKLCNEAKARNEAEEEVEYRGDDLLFDGDDEESVVEETERVSDEAYGMSTDDIVNMVLGRTPSIGSTPVIPEEANKSEKTQAEEEFSTDDLINMIRKNQSKNTTEEPEASVENKEEPVKVEEEQETDVKPQVDPKAIEEAMTSGSTDDEGVYLNGGKL